MISLANPLSRRAVLAHAGRFAMSAPLLTVLACKQAASNEVRTGFSGATMGTYYRVTISDRGRISKLDHLQADVERILRTVNGQMSTYSPDSELSHFNATARTSWVGVSPEVAHVMTTALEISRLSGSAFDATVGPLVELWGFGPDKQAVISPDELRDRSALVNIGHHHLAVKDAPTAVRKTRPELHVDLSGIGKGFAVDEIADHLERADIQNFLIDIGGDMRAHRSSPNDATWRIGIERPTVGPRTIHRVINVGEGAVATSGDYRNFFEANGSRYSHIIDPRSGAPVRHELASVTVVAATAEEADAWSTALMVLGSNSGLNLANNLGLSAFFIVRTDRGLVDLPSREFQRFLVS